MINPSNPSPAIRVFRLFAKRLDGRPIVAVVALVVLCLVLSLVAMRHGTSVSAVLGRATTDDAYIRADQIAISSHIAGYVDAVPVQDNQFVKQGQVLALIRDDDYKAKLASAEAELQISEATVDVLTSQAAVQEAKVLAAAADVRTATALLTQAQLQRARQRELVDDGTTSHRELESAEADDEKSSADRDKALAEHRSAERTLEVIEHQIAAAQQTVEAKRSLRDLAKIDLGYTRIVSPTSGQLSSRIALAGQYVTVGTQIGTLVPLPNVWVIANYREVQIADMLPGQDASVTVDSVPDFTFQGTVDSISPASGALQALLPPDNATGNFTKVAQRFAVKIVMKPGQLAMDRLRPGMSVIATVLTSSGKRQSRVGQ